MAARKKTNIPTNLGKTGNASEPASDSSRLSSGPFSALPDVVRETKMTNASKESATALATHSTDRLNSAENVAGSKLAEGAKPGLSYVKTGAAGGRYSPQAGDIGEAAGDATEVGPAIIMPNASTTAARPSESAKKNSEDVKKIRAATPTKTTERDEQGGEQKTMKNNTNRLGFKLNEYVVYPAHGVGQIVALEEQEVAGFKLELFVINFTKDKMTLRVPTAKVTGVGMRKLSDPDQARRSLEILTGRARVKRTMWSRRAQEYEAKINSGDINAIAEVVRDLYRSDAQPEQSYSERQLYEAALDRMMREIAAVQKLSDPEALKVIEVQLKKNQKRAAKPETADGEDPDIEEAA